jgi:hypothetical protein
MIAVRATMLLCLVPLLSCGEVDTTPDAAPTDPAGIFCADYHAACGFGNDLGGNAYANQADCLARFDTYLTVQRECVLEHVTFAATGDQVTNCARAEGGAPCDADSTFCAQYDLTCGFGNDFGGEPFTDTNDCQTRYDALTDARQTCVQQHLGFAKTGPEIHCPHAAGAPPCD